MALANGVADTSGGYMRYHFETGEGDRREAAHAAAADSSAGVTAGVGAFSRETMSTSSQDFVGRSSNYLMPEQDREASTTAVPFLRVSPDARSGEQEEVAEMKSDIKINQWRSSEAYLKELEQVTSTERLKKYIELKKEYGERPAFFVDVAKFFIEKNEKSTAIMVLSNICEMRLEQPELLRIVANQLMDIDEKELAAETFRQILKMREEDPQSYRDLALMYNETGEYDKAIELLYKLISGTWDTRFGDVKAIALNEMNAIISAHPSNVDISAIDKQFIYPMPVDVRIVIGWSSDNSDVDLWVTDPRKEKCYYQHTETGIGGKISRDVTQGYGPEEFLLKKALNGNYTVDVNLYGDTRQTLGGPIAIKADLFTDFGKPTQKRKTINLRVTDNKEVVNLGSLKFGS
jgi:tetratricopeptide (TPR) repeat protein